MSIRSDEERDALVASWLACPPELKRAWFEANAHQIDLACLEKLKEISDAKRRTAEADRADQITQEIMQIAQWLKDEPLAMPLACWARGNWLLDYDPKQAVLLYQQAITGYQSTGDPLTLVRLSSNLLGAALEIDTSIAFAAYEQIMAWQDQLKEADRCYLLWAEQNYGVLLQRTGRLADAIVSQERALALAQELDDAQSTGEIRVNMALTLADMGEFVGCEQMLHESRASAEAYDQQASVARIDMDLGMLYTILGRPADALRAFEKARQFFVLSQNQMELGSVLLREAALFERVGALRPAQRAYLAAQECFSTLEMWPQVGLALMQGAIALRLDHEFTQAADWLTKAETIWRAQPHAFGLDWIQLERVALALEQNQLKLANDYFAARSLTKQTLLATPGLVAQAQLLRAQLCQRQAELAIAEDEKQRRYAEAEAAYQAILTYSQAQGDHQMQRQALAGLGRLAWPSEPANAFQLMEQALQQDEMVRMALSLQELKASFLHKTNGLLLQLVEWSFALDQPEAMLRYTWRAKGAALLDLFSTTQAMREEHKQVDNESATALQALRQQLASLRWQMTMQQGKEVQPEALTEQQNPAIYALEEKLLALRRQQNREVTALIEWQMIAPGRLIAEAGADLLIEYICCHEQLFAVCVDRQGNCTHHRLATREMLLDLQDELQFTIRSALRQFAQQRAIRPALHDECKGLLGTLYQLLIAPLGTLLIHSRLLIAPCEELHKIPFAALWQGDKFLIEAHPLEMIYSGALLTATMPPLSVGEPVVIAASADGQLPNVIQEAVVIQRHFPTATCLIDQVDALTQLRQQSVAPHFFHLSAHTLERHDSPLFSALRLAEAMLSVEECYELPLSGTAVVTLSSCKTNTGMDSSGALLAFQSAFLVAGAQRVISSLWEIHGDFSVPWMDRFYGELAQGEAPAVAWRKTQLACLSDPTMNHPALWAAFVCNRR